MTTSLADDARIRRAAFSWLDHQVQLTGSDVLPRSILAEGFQFESHRVPLLGPQGIFKPAILDVPLSITTIPNGPYDDGYSESGLLSYRYRGNDPHHRDNRGLRSAMLNKLPLIYFYQVVVGRYLSVWPVFIVADNPATLTFTVQVDDVGSTLYALGSHIPGVHDADDNVDARRAYITATVRQRVHQRAFRERVLRAYHEQCALCRLRHAELLDAAHIIPDGEPEGDPVVRNGLSLCKLHHAAYDRNIIGIRSDFIVEVRQDILEEVDGPMLKHGLVGMHGVRIVLPRKVEHRPSVALLERRYLRFVGGG